MARPSKVFAAFCANAAQNCFTAFGLFMVTMACLLVTTVIYTTIATVIPVIVTPGGLSHHFHLICFGYISFGTIFNYIMAASTHPGNVDDAAAAATIELYADPSHANNPFSPFFNHAQPGQPKKCKKCNGRPKPPRSHHCSMCGDCVLKQDHHCPWINGCVGYHNQRYFCLFLLNLLCGTAYAIALISHLCYFHSERDAERFGRVCSLHHPRIGFVFILVFAIFCVMLIFVGWNAVGVLTNQSAIEFQLNKWEADDWKRAGYKYRNPFDLGKWRNMLEVFGARAASSSSSAGPPGSNSSASAYYTTRSPLYEDTSSVFGDSIVPSSSSGTTTTSATATADEEGGADANNGNATSASASFSANAAAAAAAQDHKSRNILSSSRRPTNIDVMSFYIPPPQRLFTGLWILDLIDLERVLLFIFSMPPVSCLVSILFSCVGFVTRRPSFSSSASGPMGGAEKSAAVQIQSNTQRQRQTQQQRQFIRRIASVLRPPHSSSYFGYPALLRPVRISARHGGIFGTLFLLSPTFQPMMGDGVRYDTVQMISNPHIA